MPAGTLPDPIPPLQPGEVQVWQCPLGDARSDWRRALELLSSRERERALSFHREGDALRFTLVRAQLRLILGELLTVRPAEIQLVQPSGEKPRLSSGEVYFNVAHSGHWGLLAFSRTFEVGVDVEEHHTINFVELAEACFAPAERRALAAADARELEERFFRCWTRKEAYVKGRGDGLGYPLDEFEVSLEPAPSQALLANRRDPADLTRWRVADLSIAAGYSAALAVASGESPMKQHFFMRPPLAGVP